MKINHKLISILGTLVFFLLLVPAGAVVITRDIAAFMEWFYNMAAIAVLIVLYILSHKNSHPE